MTFTKEMCLCLSYKNKPFEKKEKKASLGCAACWFVVLHRGIKRPVLRNSFIGIVYVWDYSLQRALASLSSTSVHYKSPLITTRCRPLSSSYSTVEEHFNTLWPVIILRAARPSWSIKHMTLKARQKEKATGTRRKKEEMGGRRNGACVSK